MDSPTILIAGSGYIGKALGDAWRSQGTTVVGLTRSDEGASRLQAEGWISQAADISNPAACESLATRFPNIQSVVHCAASGRGGAEAEYAAVYREGCRNLLAAFPQARLYFTSSTSVYPQIDGRVITETSEAEPRRGTGKILREAESLVLTAGGTVMRLAGIYGPGRSVLLRNFLEGKSAIDIRQIPPSTPDGRWINQIHRDDVVAGIQFLTQSAAPSTSGEIFNLTDSRPLTQREVYGAFSARFSLPLPPESIPDETRKRGWSHKQVSNAKLRALGWEPLYPSYFHALENDPLLIPSILTLVTPPDNC